MTESPVKSIEIVKEIPFFGEGDTLESRIKKVTLRGFSKVRIYENAKLEFEFLKPQEITRKLHTPQLRVYRDNLTRIGKLDALFKEKGIDILNLDHAYDYIALHESGEVTEWTMLPPIVERFSIPRSAEGNLDYTDLIGKELSEALLKESLGINPHAKKIAHTSDNGIFDLINDGSHRVHFGFENGGIKIARLTGMTKGFPYYAVPQRYNVRVFETREEALKEAETKIHVVDAPGHKNLYRVFPTGGIKSGNVRPH